MDFLLVLTQTYKYIEGVLPTNHSSSQETRLNDLPCGIKIKMSKCTRLTDGRTDKINRRTVGHFSRR